MNAYISYGGGVNSTAMTLLIMEDKRFADLRDGLRIVFADTGAEMPETLCYVRYFSNWLQERYGLEIEIVSDGNLIEYCKKYRMVPSRRYRWCTRIFKAIPLDKWARENGRDTCLVGFDVDEQHRADNAFHVGKVFPLIIANMDRGDCVRYIAEHGLELPRKSGCWICPFANKQRWIDLLSLRPDMFEEVCQMEETAQNFAAGFYLKSKPMREWIQQPEMDFGEPCAVCELM